MDNLEYELHVHSKNRRGEIEIDAISDSKKEAEDGAVQFSVDVVNALGEKAKEFNSVSKKKTNQIQLKRVFCLALGDYPNSDKFTRTEWAMARVGMYLRMVSGDLKRFTENLDSNQRVSYNKFVEITANWTPSEEDFSIAKQVIEKHNLHFKFKTIEELYLDYQPIKHTY